MEFFVFAWSGRRRYLSPHGSSPRSGAHEVSVDIDPWLTQRPRPPARGHALRTAHPRRHAPHIMRSRAGRTATSPLDNHLLGHRSGLAPLHNFLHNSCTGFVGTGRIGPDLSDGLDLHPRVFNTWRTYQDGPGRFAQSLNPLFLWGRAGSNPALGTPCADSAVSPDTSRYRCACCAAIATKLTSLVRGHALSRPREERCPHLRDR